MATFGDVAKGFDYGMNAAAKSFDGNNKYIRITDIDEVSSQYLYDDVVSPDGELEDSYLVKENDILLARTGASTGKSYLYRNSDGKLYFAGFLIRANIYKHNSYFVFSQLHTLRYKKWISVMSARSGQPGINSQEYASFPVYTTSLQEEDKIATFLKLLDERITTQRKIIDKYESLIKGLSNKLLYSKNGVLTYLYDILIERKERTEKNNQYKVLSSTINGILSQREYFSKDIASDNNIGYKVIHLYDIVLSPQNLWMGNINYNEKFNIGIVSPSYKIYIINEKYDKRFIVNLLKTHRSLYKYKIISEQGASIVRRNLDIKAFEKLSFEIPAFEEQNKIGNIFDTVKQRLTLSYSMQSLYKQQKQWLLNHLFIYINI